MSDPFDRRTRDVPPNRNFSHPNRQRATTLSSSHNQDNPPMAPSNSRYFLPLPSTLFSRSTSNLSLHNKRHLHSDTNLPHRPGTAYTSASVPDLTLTALPQRQPPLPPIPHQFGGPPTFNIHPPSPRRLVKSPPRSPTKSTKGSGWRRLGKKVKSVFRFGRKKRESRVLEIGSPYDFQHVETHGFGPLRPSGPGMATRALDTEATSEREGMVMSGGSGRPGTGYGEAAGGLGRRDAEGTAVEDDGASEWEDYEETRIFLAQEHNMERRL